MTSIEISTDRERLDVAVIHAFLANDSYWVAGISRPSVEKCIKYSLCFGAYADGRQVAFARVITDYVRFAHLLDVFVLPEFRGRGFAKLLMSNILSGAASDRPLYLEYPRCAWPVCAVRIHANCKPGETDGAAAPESRAADRQRRNLKV
jgi:GNAT superfamily N-acetyltransferase